MATPVFPVSGWVASGLVCRRWRVAGVTVRDGVRVRAVLVRSGLLDRSGRIVGWGVESVGRRRNTPGSGCSWFWWPAHPVVPHAVAPAHLAPARSHAPATHRPVRHRRRSHPPTPNPSPIPPPTSHPPPRPGVPTPPIIYGLPYFLGFVDPACGQLGWSRVAPASLRSLG